MNLQNMRRMLNDRSRQRSHEKLLNYWMSLEGTVVAADDRCCRLKVHCTVPFQWHVNVCVCTNIGKGWAKIHPVLALRLSKSMVLHECV
jgi:hypothetical protein